MSLCGEWYQLNSVSLKVSLDGLLQDIRSLERGMEMAKKEFLVQDDNTVLKDFIKTNSELLETLTKDGKTAQVSLQPGIKSKLWSALLFHASVSLSVQEAYGSAVEYFGENPKTTQPAMFFPIFGRFVKAYKVGGWVVWRLINYF